MRRIKRTGKSKRGLTLVELVVAMALTMIFMASCIMLVYPVEKIYTHTNDLSRAQLIADAVVDSMRAECSNANISQTGDVYVMSNKGDGPANSTANASCGNVLFIRRNNTYFESIAANYTITDTHYGLVENADIYDGDNYNASGDIRTRAIYRLYSSGAAELNAGYVHFGYFRLGEGATAGNPTSWTAYDFTNPFTNGAYGRFTVSLEFSDPVCDVTTGCPEYVECDVTVLNNGDAVYTRHVVLCF